jgi:hypothetical protein
MATISAKFNDSDAEKLSDICARLRIDKSEALRLATGQLWLALQIDKSFEERAGGAPKFLIKSGNPESSTRKSRKQSIDTYLLQRSRLRGSSD